MVADPRSGHCWLSRDSSARRPDGFRVLGDPSGSDSGGASHSAGTFQSPSRRRSGRSSRRGSRGSCGRSRPSPAWRRRTHRFRSRCPGRCRCLSRRVRPRCRTPRGARRPPPRPDVLPLSFDDLRPGHPAIPARPAVPSPLSNRRRFVVRSLASPALGNDIEHQSERLLIKILVWYFFTDLQISVGSPGWTQAERSHSGPCPRSHSTTPTRRILWDREERVK